jgi:hypothetical protein
VCQDQNVGEQSKQNVCPLRPQRPYSLTCASQISPPKVIGKRPMYIKKEFIHEEEGTHLPYIYAKRQTKKELV